jgi:hypothetical protein
MVLDTAANFVRSDVDADVAAGATTISVVNASLFPDPTTSTPYNCVLWDASLGSPYQDSDTEIVRVTAVDYTNNDLTVTRAQEGTADVFHPSTSAIQLSPTAKMISDVDSSLETIADFSTNEVTADVNNSAVTTDQQVLDQIGVKAYRPRDAITTQEQTITPDPVNDAITVTVQGTDHQVWVPDIPERVAHEQLFDIPDGDYSNISVVVPPYTLVDQTLAESSLDGAVHGIHLLGDNTTPTNVKFNAINVVATTGAQTPKIDGLNITGVDPFSDENVGLIFYGCTHGSVDDCSFAGSTATNGIVAYSSGVSVEGSNTGGTNLGTNDLTNGVLVKHGGDIRETNGGMSGSVTDHVARAPNGDVYLGGGGTATGGIGRAFSPAESSGTVWDGDSGEMLAPTPTYAKAAADNTKTISGTFTAYTLGQIGHEQGANIDLPNDQIVITKDGKYRLTFHPFVFDFASDSTLGARIKVNGTVVAESEQPASSLGACGYTISTQKQLDGGDAITADLRSPDSDGTLVNQLSKTWLEVEQVA